MNNAIDTIAQGQYRRSLINLVLYISDDSHGNLPVFLIRIQLSLTGHNNESDTDTDSSIGFNLHSLSESD